MVPNSKSLIVIDSDLHISEMISQYCPLDKIETIHDAIDLEQFSDPLTCPHLFIVDWAYKGQLSGPAIVNRLKQNPITARIPIIILHGHQEIEVCLDREFFTTRVLPKPMTSKSLNAKIEDILKEKNWLDKNNLTLANLISNHIDELEIIVSQFIDLLKVAPNPAPLGKIMATNFFISGHHKEAECILRTLLTDDPSNVSALNTLAKIYCKTGRIPQAYQLLKKADFISPFNTERICLLGKIELSNKDCAIAQQSFLRASQLDPTENRVKLGLEMSKTLESQAAELPVSFSGSYASLLNTLAIVEVHKGKLSEACLYYSLALDQLDCPIMKSKVMFNVGLGYLRHKDLQNAKHWFLSSQKTGADQFTKAAKYACKIANMKSQEEIVDINELTMESF